MNLQIKSSKSFWTSKRDECFSVLDMLLNRPCVGNSAENTQYQINDVIREISICVNALQVIENLLENTPDEQKQIQPNLQNKETNTNI